MKPPVVIMAGGKGTRMGKVSDVCPKPLLPVRGKPLLERIVDQLQDAGVHDVVFATGHLKREVREQFGDGSDRGVRIRYIEEEEPSGMQSAFDFIREWKMAPVIVMNGDIDTDLDFEEMMERFDQTGVDMMAVAVKYHIKIPYGVFKTEDTPVIEEKPTLYKLVNAGIYVMGRQALLHSKNYMTVVGLWNHMATHHFTTVYRHEGQWRDIGTPEQYAEANNG